MKLGFGVIMLSKWIAIASLVVFSIHYLLFKSACVNGGTVVAGENAMSVYGEGPVHTGASETDVWNCVSLYLGATHFHSLSLRWEYHRLLASVFLHQNLWHLGTNFLLIWAMSDAADGRATTQAFLFLTAIMSNFLASFASPDSLIIGASAVAFALASFRLAEAFEHRRFSIKLSLCFGALLASFALDSADHAAHLAAFSLASLFSFFRRKREEKYLVLTLALAVLLGILSVFFVRVSADQRFADATNFGCFALVRDSLPRPNFNLSL